MLNPSIAIFFAILLQCNSILKIELHGSRIVKKKKKSHMMRTFSLLSRFLCSLLSLPSRFLICSLISSDLNTILLPTSTLHITVAHFFLVGCDPTGSVVVFFYFFVCDQCLEEEVGMAKVDCGSWLDPVFGSLIVVGSSVWVMTEVGCWSLETANVWVL